MYFISWKNNLIFWKIYFCTEKAIWWAGRLAKWHVSTLWFRDIYSDTLPELQWNLHNVKGKPLEIMIWLVCAVSDFIVAFIFLLDLIYSFFFFKRCSKSCSLWVYFEYESYLEGKKKTHRNLPIIFYSYRICNYFFELYTVFVNITCRQSNMKESRL